VNDLRSQRDNKKRQKVPRWRKRTRKGTFIRREKISKDRGKGRTWMGRQNATQGQGKETQAVRRLATACLRGGEGTTRKAGDGGGEKRPGIIDGWEDGKTVLLIGGKYPACVKRHPSN